MLCRRGPLWLRLMDTRTTLVPQIIGTSRQCVECAVPFVFQACAPAGTLKVSGGRTAGTGATRAPSREARLPPVRHWAEDPSSSGARSLCEPFSFWSTPCQDHRRRSVSLLPFCLPVRCPGKERTACESVRVLEAARQDFAC